MSIDQNQLLTAFDSVLQPERFKDYGPNGLQVQGKKHISHLVSGVTASLALIEAAVAAKADAILVHHGLFWRGHDGRVTGWLKQRLALLLRHDINLYAYHLPLDAHPVWGNNAQLGLKLGLVAQRSFGEQNLGLLGESADGVGFANLSALSQHIQQVLGRTVLAVGESERPIRQVAWCSGGAQSYFEAAIEAGADVFITGEISEPQAHYARETGVAFVACGHHASERYGAPALGAEVARQCHIGHQFIDIDNPA